MTARPMTVMTDEEVARFGRDEDAGFGALTCARGRLPLLAMDVEARVAGVIATVELAQTFANTTGEPIEATYIFPLPDRAAVHHFRMEVAGRVIEGVVEERGAAREQYDEAIASGKRAAITEEERPGVFTLRVGNLLPGETAVVRLALVGPLPVDDGEVTFRFPLVVAQRYTPGTALGGAPAGLGTALDTALVPDASRVTPPVMLPGVPNPVRLAIKLTIADRRAAELASSLHTVATTERDGAVVVELARAERLDRDFIVRWNAAGSELRSSLVCADDAGAAGGTFLVTLVPPSTRALASKPRDVVFVIDRSGSMDGWKMVAARRAAARMIDTLTSRDRFAAIAFDSTYEHVGGPAALVEATDRARFRAVEALAAIDARGGTEMLAPIAAALRLFGDRHDDRARVVVLVTDGQVTNEDHLLREVAPALRDVRMFALGIDQAVNAAFLRRLAGAGGGLCELVESEDRLDAVMAKVHRRIGTPVATELALRGIGGLEIDAGSVSPHKLPDVYAGAPVTIAGRYRGAAPAGAGVELVATSLGEPFRAAVVRDPDSAAKPWLAATWARAAIRDREDRFAAGERELEGEIVAISKRYGVLSRFTAFLAIDPRVANHGGKLRQIVQPVERAEVDDLQLAGAAFAPAPQSVELRGGARSVAAPLQMKLAAPAPMARSMAAVPRGIPAGPLPTPPAAAPVVIDASSYLAKLAELARELAAWAGNLAALRLLRQRLAEWIEDVRSVGGHDALAAAVEQLAPRLANPGDVAAVAAELATLADGRSKPPAGRGAFWK